MAAGRLSARRALRAIDPRDAPVSHGLLCSALQALAMWNNALIVRQSEHLATRVAKAGSIREQIKMVYDLVLSRAPTSGELKDVAAFAEKYGMANACRVLLNSNEFIFVN